MYLVSDQKVCTSLILGPGWTAQRCNAGHARGVNLGRPRRQNFEGKHKKPPLSCKIGERKLSCLTVKGNKSREKENSIIFTELKAYSSTDILILNFTGKAVCF